MTPEDRQMLRDVHMAVVGDRSLGIKGLAEQVSDNRRDIDAIQRKIWTWSGIAAGASSAVSFIFTNLNKN